MKNQTKKEWYLDRFCNHQFAALVENERLTEFSCEKEQSSVCVGNIYKGKVVNVLSGMNAAFINCGLHRNCYLSMDESYTDYSRYDGSIGEMNFPLLKEGDEVIVQVTKPERGTKGAKVTMRLSFVGKRIIYLPNTDFLGISRKITDEKVRKSLLEKAEKMRESQEEGFILRTLAPTANTKQLKAEAKYLKNLYLEMQDLAKNAPVGAILYEGEDLPSRIMRDCLGEEIDSIHVGEEELYNRLLKLVRLRGDFPEKKLILHDAESAILEEHVLTEKLTQALSPTVSLTSGGYLVIEYTEAMTVIDVNTGSYVGEDNLEETVFKVNLEAAEEIANQVRLRNIGGIVVVDFIDMLNEKHKEAVTEKLKELLALDSAKCNVLPMSELCITQFTRKRVGNEIYSVLTKKCEHCNGGGYLAEDIFIVSRIRAALLKCFAKGFKSAIVELSDKVMKKIFAEGLLTKEVHKRWQDKRIYLVPHRTYKEYHFVVYGENSSVLQLPNTAQLLY
jgi:ribonuclease G